MCQNDIELTTIDIAIIEIFLSDRRDEFLEFYMSKGFPREQGDILLSDLDIYANG